MLELDQFISKQIMSPPEHPLAKNLELLLPDNHQASISEIREKQRREQIPGIVKRIIPLDNQTTWEYWWCVPGRLLLPEDVELLRSDRPRVEAILSKLVWLWGSCCFGEESSRIHDYKPIYDWQQIIAFVHHQGLKPDVLDIDFFPTTVKLDERHSNLSSTTPHHVAVEPDHWHIEFFQLQATNGGFELQEPKPVCSCQIWTGKPFLKHLETGEATTRYDLWVSQPVNLTNPPWQTSLFNS